MGTLKQYPTVVRRDRMRGSHVRRAAANVCSVRRIYRRGLSAGS